MPSVYQTNALLKKIKSSNLSGSFFKFIGSLILGLIIVVLIVCIIIFAVYKNWEGLGVSCGVFVICAIASFIGYKYKRGPFYFIAPSAVAAAVAADDNGGDNGDNGGGVGDNGVGVGDGGDNGGDNGVDGVDDDGVSD